MKLIKIIVFILCLTFVLQAQGFWIIFRAGSFIYTHGTMTVKGLGNYYYTPSDKYFIKQIMTYSPSSRQCNDSSCSFVPLIAIEIGEFNEDIDGGNTEDDPNYHCDNERIVECGMIVRDAKDDLIAKLGEYIKDAKNGKMATEKEFSVLREKFGRSLHTLQDFYSHSNWVERSFYGVTGDIIMDEDFEDGVTFRKDNDSIPVNSDIYINNYYVDLSTDHTCITGPAWDDEDTPQYNKIFLNDLITGFYYDSPEIYQASKYCNVPGSNSDSFSCLIDGSFRELGFSSEEVSSSKDGPYFTKKPDPYDEKNKFFESKEKCIHSESIRATLPPYIGIAKDNPSAVHHKAAVNVAVRATTAYTKYILNAVKLAGENVYTDWAILRFLGYKVEINPCDSDYSLVYSLDRKHPSGYLASSGNKIFMSKLCFKNKEIKILKRETLGGFKNRPDQYDVDYNYDNKPFNGYSGYSYYKGTKYEGLHEREMYASSSYPELIKKIESGINSNQCKFLADNFSGGKLNRDDNMWTTFCPRTGLVSALNSLWDDEK
jgi:hypothetical protein